MAKVTEYPRITTMKDNDILLVDGPDGTRTILKSNAAKDLGGDIIAVTKSGGKDKVTLNLTDSPIDLATEKDLDGVADALLPIGTASGNPAVIIDAKIGTEFKEMKVDIEPVQFGSGDPSPENVRPISGFTGAKVTRCGKNLLDLNTFPNYSTAWPLGGCTKQNLTNGFRITKANSTGGYAGFMFQLPTNVVAGKTVTFSANMGLYNSGTYNAGFRALAYRGSYTATTVYKDYFPNTSGRISMTVTFPDAVPSGSDGFAIIFYACSSSQLDAGQYTDYTDIQIEYGSTASDYEPYAGDTFDIAFPSEAGTVSGGVLDLTAGTLTVTWQMRMASSLNWGRVNDPNYNKNYFYTANTYIKGAGHRNMLNCSAYKPYVNDYFPNSSDLTIGNVYARGNNINIRDDRFESLTEWQNYIAEHDFQIVWGIQPVTYQLTPVQIEALMGLNNVWADCGSMEFMYVKDVQVQEMIAEESDGTASRAFTAGEYVIVKDKLYKVTTDVSSGTALVPGTNIEETTVGGELNRIEDETEEDVGELKTQITLVEDEVYNTSTMTAAGTSSGWRLNASNGLCSQNANYKMLKYQVKAGDTVKVVSDDRFQFQTVASVPSSGTNNRVGETYGIGTYILKVPDTATYLIVSTPETDSTAVCYLMGSNIDTLEGAIDDLKTRAANSTGNDEIVFINGGYIDTHGTTADVTNITSDNAWRYVVIECEYRNQFVVNITGGINPRAFAFIAADGTVLWKSGESYTAVDQVITAPANTKWLVLNDKKTGKQSYVNNYAINIAKDAKDDVHELAETQSFIAISGTISGRTQKVITKYIPAGSYHIKVDSVDSTDTQSTSSRIIFSDGTPNGVAIDISRANGRDSNITLPNDVRAVTFYGALNYSGSVGVDFSYNNVVLSENTVLDSRLKNIEDQIDVEKYIDETVSATRARQIQMSLPAGYYFFHVDSITTDDPDSTHTTSKVIFWDGTTDGIQRNINRENGWSEFIEFKNPVTRVDFYGVFNYTDSAGVSFSFYGVQLIGNLYKYIDNVINPYQDVAFSTAQKVKTTTHDHCYEQHMLDNLTDKGLTALALSNYYPSRPTYTIADCLSDTHDPNLWPLWSDNTDKITTIPDVIEIPNAEHVKMTNVGWHVTTPGSMFASGNQRGTNPEGVGDIWQHAFVKIKKALLYADGGGIILNHPTNYPMKEIFDALDFDDIVLGMEFFNDGDAHWHADGHDYETTGDNPIGWNLTKWDNALKSGRRCWGFAVPDHYAESHADWRGTITVFVDEPTQENVLKAIRNGAFYAQLNHTSLSLTDYVYSGGNVTITVSESATIKAIINGEVYATTTGTSMNVNVPYDAVYVRFEISTANDAIYTNPLMLKKMTKVVRA